MSEAAQALEIRNDRIETPLMAIETSGRIESETYLNGKHRSR
jgi:hypothetical protein